MPNYIDCFNVIFGNIFSLTLYWQSKQGEDRKKTLYLSILSLVESLAEFLNVMTIHNNGVEAKGLEPLLVGVHVVLQRGRLRLTKSEKKRPLGTAILNIL